MDTNQDYYSILGVLKNAELLVIKAAHKAMLKIYHPDRYKGGKAEGTRITQKINEAYTTLKDPKLRIKYDKTFHYNNSESKNESTTNNTRDSINEQWNFITKYQPEIVKLEQNLKKISPEEAEVFKIEIIQHKQFAHAKKIATALENQYLTKHFGKDSEIREFARFLLFSNKRNVAKELNKAVTMFEDKIELDSVIQQIKLRFSIYFKSTKEKEKLEALRRENARKIKIKRLETIKKEKERAIERERLETIKRKKEREIEIIRLEALKKEKERAIERERLEIIKRKKEHEIEIKRLEAIKKEKERAIERERLETLKRKKEREVEIIRLKALKKEKERTIERERLETLKRKEEHEIEIIRLETLKRKKKLEVEIEIERKIRIENELIRKKERERVKEIEYKIRTENELIRKKERERVKEIEYKIRTENELIRKNEREREK